jgi:hypothetical protein
MPRHEYELLDGIPAGSMCELGAKRNGDGRWYKPFFEFCGFSHVSIDLNGTGDYRFDLTHPIDVQAINGPFDVVTNFGTTEHVDEQEPCWRNVHALVRLGGTLISCTPLDWPKHGRWYPTEEWYLQFCELNGYELEERWGVVDSLGRKTICMRARKVADLPFTFPSVQMIEMPDGKTGAYA